MTIKEISELTGKNKSTIGRWIVKSGLRHELQNATGELQNATGNEIATFSLKEVLEILKAGNVSNAIISILKENAELKNDTLSMQNNIEKQDNSGILKIIFEQQIEFQKQIQAQNQQFMTLMLDRLDSIAKKQLPVIEVKQDYYSLVGYMKIKGIQSVTISELQKFGKMATKLSRENGKEIRRVPDERYGEVNSYHINILDNVFMF